MALLNSGRDLITSLLVGAVATPLNAANAHIAVGDGDSAFNKAHTDLQGGNKLRKAMEAAYPKQEDIDGVPSTFKVTFRSVFGTSEANWEWKEWGVANALAAGTLVNRKVEALGTKTSAHSWQITVELEIQNP